MRPILELYVAEVLVRNSAGGSTVARVPYLRLACTGCVQPDGTLERRQASALYGPERDGWCMKTGEDYGATTYVNVTFCPWCGRELPGD